jgi:serine/threonine-protein kinase
MAYHDLYWLWELPIGLTQQEEATRRAEELAPDSPETQCALGFLGYANREFDKALPHFETAQRLRPGEQATLAIGYTLRRMGKWQEAIDHFEDARWLIPRSYGLYLDCLGDTKTLMRRFDEAEQDFNVAISLDPRVGAAYLYKTRVLLGRDGDVAAAKQVMREMSRMVDMADVMESWTVSESTSNPTELRVMPDEWADLWNACEGERIERYRLKQPAKVAVGHLSQALIIEAQKGRPSAMARYDSARVYYERIVRSSSQSAVSVYHANLGLAYAGLGRCEEAIREGKEAVRLVPLSRDAFTGEQLRRILSEIYTMCGEYDAAIDEIETLLAAPGSLTVALLRVDPIWDPVRSNPRFRRLVGGN